MQNILKKTLTILLISLSIKSGNYFLTPDLYTITPSHVNSCQLFETRFEIAFKNNLISTRYNLESLQGDYNVTFLNTALRENADDYYTNKFNKVSNDDGHYHDRIYKMGIKADETLSVHYDERFLVAYSNGPTQNFLSLYGNGNYIYLYPNIELVPTNLKSFYVDFESTRIGETGCMNIDFINDCRLPPLTIFKLTVPKKHYSDDSYNTQTFNDCQVYVNDDLITSATCNSTAETLEIPNIFGNKIYHGRNRFRICNVVTPEVSAAVKLELFYKTNEAHNLYAKGQYLAKVDSPDFNTSWVKGAVLKKHEAYSSEMVLKTNNKYMTEPHSSMIFTFPGVMGFLKDLSVEIIDSLSGKVLKKDVLDNDLKMYEVKVPHSLYFENGVHVKLNCAEAIPDSHDYGYMEILMIDQYGRSIGNAHQMYVQFVE